LSVKTLSDAIAFGRIAAQYASLREQHPDIPACVIKRFIDEAPPLSLDQFRCETTRGHQWSHTGTAYGGDDASFHGEGRAYCFFCNADGDA
jgi:hypothetical protein